MLAIVKLITGVDLRQFCSRLAKPVPVDKQHFDMVLFRELRSTRSRCFDRVMDSTVWLATRPDAVEP